MIKQYVEAYNFENVHFSDDFCCSENGFIIKLRLKKLCNTCETLLQIGESIKITQRILKPSDKDKLTYFEKGECYYQKTDKDGCVPVVEIELGFYNEIHPDWTDMKLGINVLMYDITKDDLYVVYDGVNFRLVYGGKVVNNDLPFGNLKKSTDNEININSEYVSYIKFSDEKAEFLRKTENLDKKLNFYTPYGHNVFIGDVVNFYHDGIYHVLYMPDRHHHGNRWGGGGHHFEHMITRDFVDWEDAGPIWDVTEQWQSTGTGTMFFHNGKYYVAYGLHTSRTIPEDKTGSKLIKEYFEEHGETRIVTGEELCEKGLYPSGASYAVSDDGVHFTQSKKIFSACENPSIYSDGKKLVMYAGYGDCTAWSAEDIDAPWKILDNVKFECDDKSEMHNTSECPSAFEWNGYKYLIMGVTGFWRTEKNSDEYIDYASKGFDVYEGLSVPMASKIFNNRVVIAGWIGGMGWGSMMVHRELVQYKDGNLGMKWIPELFPNISEKSESACADGSFKLTEKNSYYFETELSAETEKANIQFIDNAGKVCELRLNVKEKTAQYGSCRIGENAEDLLPMYKAIKTVEQTMSGFNTLPDTLPHKCGDFALAHVCYPVGKIKVKVLVYYFEKNNCTIIDTEIAETRTLITNRQNFIPTIIKPDLEFKNSKLFKADL